MRMLDRLIVHRLAVPLVQPYRLAFGSVERFDTIIVEALDRDGRRGCGEATVLTGYTDETIDDCWQTACTTAQDMTGCNLDTARARVTALAASHPFTATAFGTAFEMIADDSPYTVERDTAVPLVGLLDAKDAEGMAAEAERLLGCGYRTFKLKVGFDPVTDAARVRLAQRAIRGRARLRIDANQGYSADEGVTFVRAIEPDDIELFEQPCRAGDWDSHAAVARASGVPMMLDESIYGLDDIERAAREKSASHIKLKLMKLVTLEALEGAIARIRELGMQPVLGNGVACDLGCWLEALVAARKIDNAGEMNGFLKARGGVLEREPVFRDGTLVLTAGSAPALDSQRLARHRVASVSHCARASSPVSRAGPHP